MYMYVHIFPSIEGRNSCRQSDIPCECLFNENSNVGWNVRRASVGFTLVSDEPLLYARMLLPYHNCSVMDVTVHCGSEVDENQVCSGEEEVSFWTVASLNTRTCSVLEYYLYFQLHFESFSNESVAWRVFDLQGLTGSRGRCIQMTCRDPRRFVQLQSLEIYQEGEILIIAS